LLLARLPAEFFLQNVARVLRRVRRDPHIDRVGVSAARPPVWIEPGEVQHVREAPAVRFSRSVSAEERDLVVGLLQREEAHLLRIVLPPQWAVLQCWMVARILKPGHYLRLVLGQRSLVQDLDHFRRLLQAQRLHILLRQQRRQLSRQRGVDPVDQILIGAW